MRRIHMSRRYASRRYAGGLGPSRIRTRIPTTRQLGQWVSLRKILRFRVRLQLSQSRCLSLLLAMSGRVRFPIPRYAKCMPKRIVFGNLEGAVRRGRGGKEKEWTDCVQSDIRAFGIAGDWKATALTAEEWVETVTEGGRRFMAAWRKEEVEAARHRQEKKIREKQRDWETCYGKRECRILRSHTHRPSRRVEGILVRTRDRPRPA